MSVQEIPEINSGAAAWIPFECYDKEGVLEVPVTLEYRIDSVSTKDEIRGDTTITPASTGEVLLTPSDTTLQGQDNSEELRVLTMTSDKGTDTQHVECYRFMIKNTKTLPC